jgi:prophage DNA circulation protein
MAKAIINKHIDSVQDVVLTELFVKDETKNKGELLICNDPENPTIYIMDTTGNPRKIAGGGGSGSSEAYDDTAIWNAVNKNTEAIADLKENPSGNIDEVVETLTKDIDSINETVKTLDGTVTGITETVNGVTENLSTVSASIGAVPEGSTLVEMVNDVQAATEANAQAIEDTKTTISGVESALTEEIESLKLADSNLNSTINSVDTKLTSTIDSIGTVAEGATVVGMINDVQAATEANAQAIADNRTIIDEYTVNGKKISENPVLSTDDILVADNYSTLNKPADNVYPGDIITTAISKLEIMLANTTLALTAAINDLENRLQTLEDLYKESNTEPEA